MKAKTSRKMTLAEVKEELAEVARIGQMFVDGDLCRKALQPYAETYMTGDDMDFNPETCVPLKKTLMRLDRLSRVACATALWRRRPDFPEVGEALIFSSVGSPLGSQKPPNRGYKPPKMVAEMATAFVKGKPAWRIVRNTKETGTMIDRGLSAPVRSPAGTRTVELFVPVKDSMGEIAAVLEVFTVAVGR